jgi:hypothetical protein
MENTLCSEPISNHRIFARNYNAEEMVGEVRNLIGTGKYQDFIFVAAGEGGRSVRIGSIDNDLRIGDLLYLIELARQDVLRI